MFLELRKMAWVVSFMVAKQLKDSTLSFLSQLSLFKMIFLRECLLFRTAVLHLQKVSTFHPGGK